MRRTKRKKQNTEHGITLIALVITVIILLILAGTAINLSMNSEDLFGKTRTAAEEWNISVANEKSQIQNAYKYIELTIPEGLAIGDKVKWTPSGHYTWDKDVYASNVNAVVKARISGQTDSINYAVETKELFSGDLTKNIEDIKNFWEDGNNLNFTINEWRVLSIDNEKKEVRLVPTKVTIPVALDGAMGYNNGVKLLNDACKALYGGNLFGVEVHNINMDDMEGTPEINGIMSSDTADEIIRNAKSNIPVTNVSQPYGSTDGVGFPANRSQYPTIYAETALRKITNSDNSKNESETGLGVNQARETFITRENQKITDTVANEIVTKTVKSIEPTQLYYVLFKNKLIEALGPTNTSIILPDGDNTRYWISTRTIFLADTFCTFGNFCINNSMLESRSLMHSSESVSSVTSFAYGLFPIVTLSAGNISEPINHECIYTPLN